jgi:hypothetical protein
MSDKRPWTPAPWFEEVLDYSINNRLVYHQGGNFKANELLASKAPEMAELLIEIVKQISDINTYYGRTTIDDIAAKAKALLEEVGYENLAQD